MVDIVQVLAERPREDMVVVFLIRRVPPPEHEKDGEGRTEAKEVLYPEHETGLWLSSAGTCPGRRSAARSGGGWRAKSSTPFQVLDTATAGLKVVPGMLNILRNEK